MKSLSPCLQARAHTARLDSAEKRQECPPVGSQKTCPNIPTGTEQVLWISVAGHEVKLPWLLTAHTSCGMFQEACLGEQWHSDQMVSCLGRMSEKLRLGPQGPHAGPKPSHRDNSASTMADSALKMALCAVPWSLGLCMASWRLLLLYGPVTAR